MEDLDPNEGNDGQWEITYSEQIQDLGILQVFSHFAEFGRSTIDFLDFF